MLTVWVHVPVNLSPLIFKFKRIKVRAMYGGEPCVPRSANFYALARPASRVLPLEVSRGDLERYRTSTPGNWPFS
jgi:hypothetical protein